MNSTVMTLDQALDAAMALPNDEQEMLVEIMRKRIIEKRRDEIAENAKEAIRAFRTGDLEKESFDDLLNRLHSSSIC